MPHNSANPQKVSQPMNSSYATATKVETGITKEQAIILDALVDAPHEEYIISLSKVVEAFKIHYSSRIANNRICVYLDSKQTADTLINSKKTIVVSHQIIPIRPYVTRNKRIVISNVHPLIEDSFWKKN